MTDILVCEGWWHPNVNAGRVHDHPERPGRGWSSASHRQCEQVYTKRTSTVWQQTYDEALAEEEQGRFNQAAKLYERSEQLKELENDGRG